MNGVFGTNTWQFSEVELSILMLALNDYIEQQHDPTFDQAARKQLLAKLDEATTLPPDCVASYLLVRARVQAR